MGFDRDRHIRRGHPISFGLLIFFGLIEAIIATWLTVKFNQHHNYYTIAIRDRTRFILFTSWFTFLFASIYLILFLHSASSGSGATSVGSHVIFLSLIWIFWTAGAASITQALGGGLNCSTLAVNIIYCNQLNALEGFAWVEWILTTFILIMVFLIAIGVMRRGDGWRGQLVTV